MEENSKLIYTSNHHMDNELNIKFKDSGGNFYTRVYVFRNMKACKNVAFLIRTKQGKSLEDVIKVIVDNGGIEKK